jgi:hypothetical protein
MYLSTAHVKDAVKQWSTLTLHREFRVVKSSPKIHEVHCKKPDCAFRVYAYKGKWDHYIEVREVVPHTCTLNRCKAPKHFNRFCCKTHVPYHCEMYSLGAEGHYRCN